MKKKVVLPDFDAVIFDMDGVIFDSERLVLEGWQEIAAKYGIEGIDEQALCCPSEGHADERYGSVDALCPCGR